MMGGYRIVIDKWINGRHITKDSRGVYTIQKLVGNTYIKKSYYYFSQKEALKDFTSYVRAESIL